MTALAHSPIPTRTEPLPAHSFSVGLDGRPRGDDGHQGHLAAAVHYACRMAAQLESTLDLGPLEHLHLQGGRVLDVAVRWGMGGECLLDGAVRSGLVTPRTGLPRRRTSGSQSTPWVAAYRASRSAAQLDAALRHVHSISSAAWTVLLDSELTALRLFGDLPAGQLAVLSSRVHGVLHGLQEPDVAGLCLSHADGTLVVVPLQEGLVVMRVEALEPELAETLADEIHTVLTSDNPGQFWDSAPDAEVDPDLDVDADIDLDDVARHEGDRYDRLFADDRVVVPTGARFAGMLEPRAPRAARKSRRRDR